MSVATGEAIAQMMRRQREGEGRVARLLDAVRVLAREDDERHGAQVIAALAVELLDADAAAVLLGNTPHARRFQHRGWFGHPALADAVPIVVDARDLHDYVRSGETRFHEDASTVAGARRRTVTRTARRWSSRFRASTAPWVCSSCCGASASACCRRRCARPPNCCRRKPAACCRGCTRPPRSPATPRPTRSRSSRTGAPTTGRSRRCSPATRS